MQARSLMQRARAEHFAVGAFNVDNQETLLAIVRVAQVKQAPVLAEVSHGEVGVIGLANMRALVDNYRAEYGVEMYINLDHSPSVEAAKAGIDAGFEFIHIDYSASNREASEDEIIGATREIVAYARQTTGALVKSEPHYFGGSSNAHADAIDYDEICRTFATPDGAAVFIQRTGVDTFAAAVGNLHRRYPVLKQLDLELLQQIRDVLGVTWGRWAPSVSCTTRPGCSATPSAASISSPEAAGRSDRQQRRPPRAGRPASAPTARGSPEAAGAGHVDVRVSRPGGQAGRRGHRCCCSRARNEPTFSPTGELLLNPRLVDAG